MLLLTIPLLMPKMSQKTVEKPEILINNNMTSKPIGKWPTYLIKRMVNKCIFIAEFLFILACNNAYANFSD